MEGFGLYVHIPFCKQKCKYCDFYSKATDATETSRYFAALNKELILQSERLKDSRLDTVFIGGGTPSLVDAKYIAEVMKTVKDNYNYDVSEATIECNPESISAEKLSAYREAGLNRISIGVQSLNDGILKIIGRVHDKNTAVAAVKLAKEYFDNVSVDVMIGLPTQTVDDVADTLEKIIGLNVTHVSAYGLKIEENTELCRLESAGKIKIDDDLTADMYDFAVDYLEKRGYARYEVSNFALEGKISKHNLSYWQRKPYLGVGAAAYSFLDDTRFNNARDINAYIEALINGKIPAENLEVLSLNDCKEEEIMLSLRTKFGLDLSAYNKRYGEDFLLSHADALKKNKDYLIINDGYLHISPNYFYISNSILSDLI